MRAERTIRARISASSSSTLPTDHFAGQKIAGLIQRARKPCLVVLNKWDLVRTNRKQRQTMEAVIANARAELFFIDYAPVLVTSALTGEHADTIFKSIERIRRAARRAYRHRQIESRIAAGVATNPPPMVKGVTAKAVFTRLNPAGTNRASFAPPEIVLFVQIASPYSTTAICPVFLKRRFVSSSPTRDYRSC